MKRKLFSIFLCAIFIFTFNAFGAEDTGKPVAEVMYDSSGISFMPVVSYHAMSLAVSCPNGEVIERNFTSGQSPYLSLADLGDNFSDGSYTFELRTSQRVMPRGDGDRKKATPAGLSQSFTQSGHFLVQNGAIINGNIPEPQNAVAITADTSGNSVARVQDQVIVDDLIVQSSLCVGMDCYNGESFGFDTIRLKENNLRIRFQDTSSTASFPSNDWMLTANDSANGGANKFSIDDINSGKTPFTIEAGTRANALYVDDSGRVGLGTATPSEDLHIWYGDTPTVRLHQSGSGWAPQTWDVAGNEANFFIRDVTNGSRLPFRIQPSTPSNTLCLKSNGKVGIGTWDPSYTLEVQTTGTGAKIIANRIGGAIMEMSASSSNGIAGTKSDHPFQLRVKDLVIMELNGSDATNYLEMAGGGTYDGKWNDSSSRELKENIKELSTGDAMKALQELLPIRYNYKLDNTEEHIGFIAEDVPELVANKNRKTISSMDIVAVLTKVVQDHQKLVQEQDAVLKQQQNTIEELKKEVAKLKEQVDKK